MHVTWIQTLLFFAMYLHSLLDVSSPIVTCRYSKNRNSIQSMSYELSILCCFGGGAIQIIILMYCCCCYCCCHCRLLCGCYECLDHFVKIFFVVTARWCL